MIGLGLGLAVTLGTGGGGGGGVAMPSGAIGLWYADEYDAPTRSVKNAAAASLPRTNILRQGRRVFSSNYWGNGSATRADSGLLGPDGKSEASLITMSANQFLSKNVTLPAGTYTLAGYYMRDGASDQPFRMSIGFGSPVSKVATSTWQRFSATFTVGAGSASIIPAWTPDAATPATVRICDVGLYAGSSDLGGVETTDGHLYLGDTAFDARATYASGLIDYSSVGYGYIQFNPVSLTDFTISFTALRTATGGQFQSLLSKVQNYLQFSAYITLDQAPAVAPLTTAISGQDLWALPGQGLHVLTYVRSGTNLSLYVDNVLLHSLTVSGSTITFADLYSGVTNGEGNNSSVKWNSMALYPTALSSADRAAMVAAQKARAAATANSITAPGYYYFAEGDSITAPRSYANYYGPTASPTTQGSVRAVGGSTLASMSARIPTLISSLVPGAVNKVSILIGANNLYAYSGGGAQYAADLAVQCDIIRAAGARLYIGTVTPRSDATLTAPQIVTHNTERAVFNSIVRTWVGVHCDGVMDFAADATMGPDSASDNATYYSDKLHPTVAGQQILKTIAAAVIDGL